MTTPAAGDDNATIQRRLQTQLTAFMNTAHDDHLLLLEKMALIFDMTMPNPPEHLKTQALAFLQKGDELLGVPAAATPKPTVPAAAASKPATATSKPTVAAAAASKPAAATPKPAVAAAAASKPATAASKPATAASKPATAASKPVSNPPDTEVIEINDDDDNDDDGDWIREIMFENYATFCESQPSQPVNGSTVLHVDPDATVQPLYKHYVFMQQLQKRVPKQRFADINTPVHVPRDPPARGVLVTAEGARTPPLRIACRLCTANNNAPSTIFEHVTHHINLVKAITPTVHAINTILHDVHPNHLNVAIGCNVDFAKVADNVVIVLDGDEAPKKKNSSKMPCPLCEYASKSTRRGIHHIRVVSGMPDPYEHVEQHLRDIVQTIANKNDNEFQRIMDQTVAPIKLRVVKQLHAMTSDVYDAFHTNPATTALHKAHYHTFLNPAVVALFGFVVVGLYDDDGVSSSVAPPVSKGPPLKASWLEALRVADMDQVPGSPIVRLAGMFTKDEAHRIFTLRHELVQAETHGKVGKLTAMIKIALASLLVLAIDRGVYFMEESAKLDRQRQAEGLPPHVPYTFDDFLKNGLMEAQDDLKSPQSVLSKCDVSPMDVHVMSAWVTQHKTMVCQVALALMEYVGLDQFPVKTNEGKT